MSDQDETTKIRCAALNWLARRDYSRHEIELKLKVKFPCSENIHDVLENLVQAGLINEQRYLENYIYWRKGRGFGPLRISQELQSRGISLPMIAEHLKITDNAWFAEARKVWQKQFKGKLPEDFRLRAKQMRFLQYRGFTREQIASVITGDLDE